MVAFLVAVLLVAAVLCCAAVLLVEPTARPESRKTILRYRVKSVRFRINGLPYSQDLTNLAEDCGVEVFVGRRNCGATIPKCILGYKYGERHVEFGPCGEVRAMLAAILATNHGRQVLAKSTILG